LLHHPNPQKVWKFKRKFEKISKKYEKKCGKLKKTAVSKQKAHTAVLPIMNED